MPARAGRSGGIPSDEELSYRLILRWKRQAAHACPVALAVGETVISLTSPLHPH